MILYNIKSLYQFNEDVGYSKEEFQSIIHTFGNFPKILIEYYLQLGKDKSLNEAQDGLLQPKFILKYIDCDYIPFYEENQGNYNWSIAKKDLSLDNPPVYISFDYHSKVQILENNKLSNFLEYKAYLNATQDDWEDNFEKEFLLKISVEILNIIKKEYPLILEYSQIYDVNFIDYDWRKEDNKYSNYESTTHQFLSKYDDEIIWVDSNPNSTYDITYSTKNVEHLEEFKNFIEKNNIS